MGATNCPETPRQRMIAMMYLVLTALLALNVSREIVDSFILVEDALSTSVENFNDKNESIYNRFSLANDENPVKVGPWFEKAKLVESRADSLSEYIQSLKIEIIHKADGDPCAAVKGNTVYSDSIIKTDNLDIGGEVMIGAEQNGEAFALREAINSYKDFLKDKIIGDDVSQVGLINSFNKTLDTSDPDKAGNPDAKNWEIAHFDNLPLIAVITILSKLQTDIANTESDAVNYLFKKVGDTDVKVNKIEAVVKAKSNYIFKDSKYEAEVFLAAFDTTQVPVIKVGRVDSTQRQDGSWEYFMPGTLGVDYDTLPIVNGRGTYSTIGRSLSPSVNWGGLIEVPAKGGTYNIYPFKADYQVSEAGLVVSPTKMNVFYIGVENPVDISVPGVPKENIIASMTNGTITEDKKNGGWIVKPIKADAKGTKTTISVMSEIDGKKREMGSVAFRVKTVPDPIAKVADKKGGTVAKTILLAQTGVFCEIENFDFEMPFKVTSFEVSANIKGYEVVEGSKSNIYTKKQIDLIKKLKRGNKVNFENIKAKGQDNIPRNLSPLIFKLK